MKKEFKLIKIGWLEMKVQPKVAIVNSLTFYPTREPKVSNI